jgi:hypothetical protein
VIALGWVGQAAKFAREFHASRWILGVKRIHIFDEEMI